MFADYGYGGGNGAPVGGGFGLGGSIIPGAGQGNGTGNSGQGNGNSGNNGNTGNNGNGTGSHGHVLGAETYHFASEMNVGYTSEAVTALQNLLTSLGFYTGPITGQYGPLTKAAVKAFQTARGIPPTGAVGPKTLAALNTTTSALNTTAAQRLSLMQELLVKLQALRALLGR